MLLIGAHACISMQLECTGMMLHYDLHIHMPPIVDTLVQLLASALPRCTRLVWW